MSVSLYSWCSVSNVLTEFVTYGLREFSTTGLPELGTSVVWESRTAVRSWPSWGRPDQRGRARRHDDSGYRARAADHRGPAREPLGGGAPEPEGRCRQDHAGAGAGGGDGRRQRPRPGGRRRSAELLGGDGRP